MEIELDKNNIDLWIDGLILEPPLSPLQLACVQQVLKTPNNFATYDNLLSYLYGTTKRVTMRFDSLVRRINERVPNLIKRKRGHGVYINKAGQHGN